MSMSVLIINGPNLNLLGTREPGVYGARTLREIEEGCVDYARGLGIEVECVQSNHEGQIVDWIQGAADAHAGLILNAGAYTHTSVAILDALKASSAPAIEVHLSNIHQREDFRHQSYVSKVAWGVICGFGELGYHLAIQALAKRLDSRKT